MTVAQQEDKPKEIVTYNDFGDKLLKRMYKNPDKLHCIIWTFPNGQENGFGHVEVKLDAQEFEYAGKRYIIDRNKIQNRLGVFTYNTTVNDATGGLSFVKKDKNQKEVDAKNYAEGVRRNWFTALWGQWKLPFIALIISMGIALALAFVAMFFGVAWKDTQAELDTANKCLQDVVCMAGKINQIQSQQVTPPR